MVLLVLKSSTAVAETIPLLGDKLLQHMFCKVFTGLSVEVPAPKASALTTVWRATSSACASPLPHEIKKSVVDLPSSILYSRPFSQIMIAGHDIASDLVL